MVSIRVSNQLSCFLRSLSSVFINTLIKYCQVEGVASKLIISKLGLKIALRFGKKGTEIICARKPYRVDSNRQLYKVIERTVVEIQEAGKLKFYSVLVKHYTNLSTFDLVFHFCFFILPVSHRATAGDFILLLLNSSAVICMHVVNLRIFDIRFKRRGCEQIFQIVFSLYIYIQK